MATISMDLSGLEAEWFEYDSPRCAACGRVFAETDDEVPLRLWRKDGREGLSLLLALRHQTDETPKSMNAKTAKLICRVARDQGDNPRELKRRWLKTPPLVRAKWRVQMKYSLEPR